MIASTITSSVIILAWQDHEMTASCLASLGTQAQLIVVDNGSDEDYARQLVLECTKYGAEYIRAPHNLGFAGGMNLGLNAARGDVVVFSNNDIVASPEALTALAGACFEPGVGAVFPEILDGDGVPSTACGRFLTLGRAIAHALGLTLLANSKHRLESDVADAEWFSGPFVAMRRQLAISIGGMPSQSFMYSEDYRLCAAIRGIGLWPHLLRGTKVRHLDDASALKVWTSHEVAGLQTRELVVAAADQQRTRARGTVLAAAFVFGTWWRYRIRPSPLRLSILESACEGFSKFRRPALSQKS